MTRRGERERLDAQQFPAQRARYARHVYIGLNHGFFEETLSY